MDVNIELCPCEGSSRPSIKSTRRASPDTMTVELAFARLSAYSECAVVGTADPVVRIECGRERRRAAKCRCRETRRFQRSIEVERKKSERGY